jgi:dTDP-4-amino-4,6-dideoxygalactose transaminase
MDPDAVRAAVGPRTVAIVPVHLFGQVAPVEEIGKIAADAGVPMIEDAAQSQGARRNGRGAATFGLAAGTSFYPGKNLGAAGDAGAVLTSDGDVARQVRVLSAHGSAHKYDHEVVGVNSRLDTVQAVVLAAKLRRLDAWNAARRAAAARYADLLAGVDRVRVPVSAEGNEDVWHLYVVQVEERDRVLAALQAAGIGAGIHYPTPIHLTGAYASLGYGRGAFPVAEAAADRILSLPLFPHITAAQQERVVDVLASAVRVA